MPHPDLPVPAGSQATVADALAHRPVMFISDLHLTPERPIPYKLFRQFLQNTATQASALYILGDFFEAWVGDDDLEHPFHAEVATLIHQQVDSGVPVFFMPGNRDFLVGEKLAQATGWKTLADPTVIELFGTLTLLSHGDAYCLDDAAYLTFREQVRTPAWQSAFLARPLAERREMARAIREKSEQAKAGKKPSIMDASPVAIELALQQTTAQRLIHGHTHRPAKHIHPVNGRLCERWVLPDWYETGGYLRCDHDGCQLVMVSC